MAKVKLKKGERTCLCAEGTHDKQAYISPSSRSYPVNGDYQPTHPDYPFHWVCAKGHRAQGGPPTVLGFTEQDYRKIYMAPSVADFYMLEALSTGMLGAEFFPRAEDPQSLLWRRSPEHRDVKPLSTGQYVKPCECTVDLTESGRLDACEHDGSLSDHYWYMYRSSYDSHFYLRRVKRRAEKLQKKLVKKLKKAFISYGLYAFGTEMSYCHALPYCEEDYPSLLGGLFHIYEQMGPKYTFDQVQKCFDPSLFGWSGSFGGKAWYSAAHVYYLHATKKLTDKLFVDRVFSLQHNTGSFLNKVSWGDYPNVVQILEAHKNSLWKTLYTECSPEVKELTNAYWDALNDERERVWGLGPVHPYHTSIKYTFEYHTDAQAAIKKEQLLHKSVKAYEKLVEQPSLSEWDPDEKQKLLLLGKELWYNVSASEYTGEQVVVVRESGAASLDQYDVKTPSWNFYKQYVKAKNVKFKAQQAEIQAIKEKVKQQTFAAGNIVVKIPGGNTVVKIPKYDKEGFYIHTS